MRTILCVFVLAILASACQSGGKNTEPNTVAVDQDNQPPADNPKSFCFVHTEGTANQDTTHITITIHHNKVAGTMDWIPLEKDGAHGTIEGIFKDNLIKGTYHYVIEGSEQSEEVEFKLDGEHLLQKRGELMEKTPGSADLVFKDASKAEFSLVFNKVSCD